LAFRGTPSFITFEKQTVQGHSQKQVFLPQSNKGSEIKWQTRTLFGKVADTITRMGMFALENLITQDNQPVVMSLNMS